MPCRTRVGRLTLALIAVALAGCSSTATRTATTRSTAPIARTATTIRPALGFHDTTPAPVIHATGSDFVAIVSSLMNYRDWLASDHPDPALTGEVIQPGTALFASDVSYLTTLRTKHLTVASVDKQLNFTVVSVHGPLTTFRLRETLVSDQWFDAAHRVVRTDPYPQPNNYVVVMARDATGRWSIADITRVSLDPAIVLSP